MTPQIDVTIGFEAWSAAVEGAEDVCRRAALETLAHVNHARARSEISLLLCDDVTISDLNGEYRGQARPTNVLSFPIGVPDGGPAIPLLGDVAIAFETVAAEAAAAGLSVADHMTHMVVHGVLHLLGYDHQLPDEAEEMEALEADVLKRLGIANPYATCSDSHAPASGHRL